MFGPVASLSAEEFRRGTDVTYLGQVHGTMAALRYMRPRNGGSIVSVGSALAYRAVPLQSVYCGAKFAIRGFVDSLRSEIIHDKLNISLSMVDLPAVNTPQFDWALNKTGRRAQPVPPIFPPEIPARAIYFAALHPRRQTWIGFPTVKAILANRIAPGLLDRYLAKAGYAGQLTKEPLPVDAPDNLFHPVPGPYGAHGRFDARARQCSWEVFTSRHRNAMWALAGLAMLCGIRQIVKRR
ncbi:MAG: SDR family oxidoreductase [Acetobacteraceae bacterium]